MAMSWRNYRKQLGQSLPPPDSDDSDGDYDPLHNRQKNKFTYQGLEVSSHSESEREPDADEEDDGDSVAYGGARKKKPQKKKGKGKKSKPTANANVDLAVASTSAMSGSTSGRRQNVRRSYPPAIPELDEIDRSLMEVNALLGEPPPAPPEPEIDLEFEEMKVILGTHPKYLNVCNELKRLFGPEEPEEIKNRNKLQPHRVRLLKKVMVSPTTDTPIYNFKRGGLSMSIVKRENDVTYFVYDHDLQYQKMHSAYLVEYTNNFTRSRTFLASTNLERFDAFRRRMHVEALLEVADILFRLDENSLANEIVENVVTYFQYCAHHSFNLSSLKVRLLYSYLENRPFHVAMLKYLYLLSNKACHRTALEIAKMLMNIDPSDPMAVLFIIDTLALRAREHQWLIDAIEYLNKHRQASMLYNIQYSHALAQFHVATKNKRDLTDADQYLQVAIMSYPAVVVRIFEYANIKEQKVLSHKLFEDDPPSESGEGLNELILIYAKLTWERWREPRVIDWFIRNVVEATENYDNSHLVRRRAKELANLRRSIFQVWPTEILRHVLVIKNMANLLMETTLYAADRRSSGWDPLFDRGINRYSYSAPIDQIGRAHV